MPHRAALQPVPEPADREQLAAREAELCRREQELDDLKRDLQQLQSRYLQEMGGYYAELSTLEAAVVEAEVRAGIRPPPTLVDDEPDAADPGETADMGCGNAVSPSVELKRVFRHLARTIHPDLAMDEPARYRRHSLMAEANRAYAEQDEDRLLLILRTWERSPEAVVGDDPEATRTRIARRLAEIDERLLAVAAEFAELRASAIWRLKVRIDEARAQGWDLFAEMVLQVRSEIRRAEARLAKLRRTAGTTTPA